MSKRDAELLLGKQSYLPGRANVGKSSLLNAVLGRKDLLFTSKKAVSNPYCVRAVVHDQFRRVARKR